MKQLPSPHAPAIARPHPGAWLLSSSWAPAQLSQPCASRWAVSSALAAAREALVMLYCPWLRCSCRTTHGWALAALAVGVLLCSVGSACQQAGP